MSDLYIDLYPTDSEQLIDQSHATHKGVVVQTQSFNVVRYFTNHLLNELCAHYLDYKDILSMGCVAKHFKEFLNQIPSHSNLITRLLTFMGLNPIHDDSIDLEWYENGYCGPSFHAQNPAPDDLAIEISRTLIINQFIDGKYCSDHKVMALFQYHLLMIKDVTLQIETDYAKETTIKPGFFDLLRIFFNLPLNPETVIDIESLSLRCKQFMIAFEAMNKSPHITERSSLSGVFRTCIQLQIDMVAALPADDDLTPHPLREALEESRRFCMRPRPSHWSYFEYQRRYEKPSQEGFYIYHDFIQENKKAVKTHCWSIRSHVLIIPEQIPCFKAVESVSFRFNTIAFLSPNFPEKFPALKELYLAKNLLGPGSMLVISKLTNLEILDLRCNKHLTSILPDIGLLINLKKLYLCHTGLTSLPVEIGLLTNLKKLDIRGTMIQSIPDEILTLPNLKKFLKPDTLNIQTA